MAQKSGIISALPEEQWRVIAADTGQWRVGIYKPDYTSPDGVNVLERHSCPELFICVEGKMGLIVLDHNTEQVIEMLPGEAFMVDDFHNGFSLSSRGYFVVVERTSFETVYIDRATRMETRRIRT